MRRDLGGVAVCGMSCYDEEKVYERIVCWGGRG
jgi:hypothetical protein